MAAELQGISRRMFLGSASVAPALALSAVQAPAEAPAKALPAADKDEPSGYKDLKAEFVEYGFVVLPKLIPRADAESVERRVRQIMGRRPDADKIDQHLPGFFNHLEASDDKLFMPLVTQPFCLRLAHDLLGPGFQMTEVGCRWRKPGAPDGEVHVGTPLPAMARAGLPVPNTTFVIGISWVLHDITKDMGTSYNLPFSHHAPLSPRVGARYQHLVPLEAPAGSLLVYHGGLWHKFGANTTKDKPRVGLMGGYFPFWMDPAAAGWLPLKKSIRDRLPEEVQRMNRHVVEG